MKTKTCSLCSKAKPLVLFSLNRHSPDGRDYRCKACFNRQQGRRRRAA